NLTLMALGSSSPEILLSIIEIVGNRFEAGELGPGTIISKDVVDLWEAVITFLLFPVVVLLAYMAEKNFFAAKEIDMGEEERKLILKPSEVDPAGNVRMFRREELLQFLRDLGQAKDLSLEEKAQLFAAKLSENMPRSRMQYRIQGVRMLTGSKSLFPHLSGRLQEIYQQAVKQQLLDGTVSPDSENENQREVSPRINIDDDQTIATIEFASSNYAVLEREQRVTVDVVRYGATDSVVRFRLDTIDGTATAGEDYIKLSEEFKMEPGELEKKITINVIDDNQWEPDETFFVKLSLADEAETHIKLGTKTIALITIINDDEPGDIEFEEVITLVKESVGNAEIKVVRVNGADGRVTVHYRTEDIDATGKKDYEHVVDKELVFEHGEISKVIAISIIDDFEAEKDESFAVELFDPKGGAKLGKHSKTVVTIINDDDYKSMANKLASLVQIDLDQLSVTKTTWGQQFREAMNVNGGDIGTATFGSYIGHAISFFWKVLFAFVPPTSMAGGWLTFVFSLIFIAILTAIVGDVAAIFGCLVGLKDSITAISFVALGTSLPDTFASMFAAKNCKTADDAIGNVTGSNSVNV
ncbi:unnamed protein product, partial [Rotaria sp. Silwood1]